MNQPQMHEVTPDHYFEEPLGFESLQIATTVDVVATSKPQNVFRPTRLLVPSTLAPFFLIKNIRIGTDSQLVGTTPMPAQVYSELAVPPRDGQHRNRDLPRREKHRLGHAGLPRRHDGPDLQVRSS